MAISANIGKVRIDRVQLPSEDMLLDMLRNRDPTRVIPPLHEALPKDEQDVMLFERLAFMARRQN